MKVTLELNLPDQQERFDNLMNGSKWKYVVREDYTIQLEEVFNAIVIKTTDGVEFGICQRDWGIEVTCNGVTKYLDKETFNTKDK